MMSSVGSVFVNGSMAEGGCSEQRLNSGHVTGMMTIIRVRKVSTRLDYEWCSTNSIVEIWVSGSIKNLVCTKW